MTYRLTPRWERLRTLHAARDRIDAQILALETADTDEPETPEAPESASAIHARNSRARSRLLRWSASPEFRHKVATYSGTSDQEQEMTA